MTGGPGEKLSFAKGLSFRLGALLSVAILPIGLISLVTTTNLAQEAKRSAEIALLGRTAAAAAGERALLQGALGSADALGPAVLKNLLEPTDCAEMMRRFIERSATYVHAGFTPEGGQSRCNSDGSGAVQDMRGSNIYQNFISQPSTLVSPAMTQDAGAPRLVVIAQPLYRDRDLLGYVSVSISQELLQSTHANTIGTEGAHILTFNQNGAVLSSDSRLGDASESILPRGETLASLLDRTETTFTDFSNAGEERVFSVVQVVPGLVFALGSWSLSSAGFQGSRFTTMGAILFPIVLWLASLGVAYFAIYRLVLRPIRELRGQMRRYALGDRSAPPRILSEAPSEIADVSHTFQNMARILSHDEAALEASIAEKTVLLKEVHHRVKNNLQLIASIINMQSRVVEDEDAGRVLRSVQDRVASLATIYRNLYQAEQLDAVEADRLIGDILNQMVNASASPDMHLDIDTDLRPLTLLPDQAVPLTLLATEAITNALKYTGAPSEGTNPRMRVALKPDGIGHARFEVANTLGKRRITAEGSGLGSQLIEAFATQLDGEAEITREPDRFSLSLRFAVDGKTSEMPSTEGVVLTSAARDGAQH